MQDSSDDTSDLTWQGEEITVQNWNELQAALHSEEIVPMNEKAGKHRRSVFLFRGMSNAAWRLETSLERLGTPPERVELPLLRSFHKYARTDVISIESEWKRLSIAQHNGLPTRVMDWTGSPLIAAHFATQEKKYRVGAEATDGVIWCVQAKILRDAVFPEKLRQDLYDAQAFLYNVPLLETLYPSLRHFDATADDLGEFMMFFEPPSLDARIQNQFGLLSIMNSSSASHHSYLQEKVKKHTNLVKRVIIKQEAKAEIRDMLDQNNITERMLFPGLPGLCDWLKRYYGPV